MEMTSATATDSSNATYTFTSWTGTNAPFTGKWKEYIQPITRDPIMAMLEFECIKCHAKYKIADKDVEDQKDEKILLNHLCPVCRSKSRKWLDGLLLKGIRLDNEKIPLPAPKLIIVAEEEIMSDEDLEWHLFQKSTFGMR